MNHFFKKINTPVGQLTLVARENKLVAILWEDDTPDRVKLPGLERSLTHEILLKTETQLQEYFDGKRKRFQLPLYFQGTSFQVNVWRQLQAIPYATTKTYSELAREIGSPKACRAVGGANRRNPISIVVPCHRVIGANGTLTGFAGGMKAKAFLLELERGLGD